MSVNGYLMDEIKRLNRMNDLLEKEINKGNATNNEPEQILKNISTMCEIVRSI